MRLIYWILLRKSHNKANKQKRDVLHRGKRVRSLNYVRKWIQGIFVS